MTGRKQDALRKPGKASSAKTEKLVRTPITEKRTLNEEFLCPMKETAFIRDPAYQLRGRRSEKSSAVLDRENVNRLSGLLQQGVEFKDPIKLFRIVSRAGAFKTCVLVDGFHRTWAAQETGHQSLRAVIVGEGTKADAMREAGIANSDHGLPRAEKDGRDAIKRFMLSGAFRDKKTGEAMQLTGISKMIGITKSVATVRRWVQADCPTVYANFYARGDNEERADGPQGRVRKIDYALEVDGLLTQLAGLMEKMEAEATDSAEAAAKLSLGLSKAAERLMPLWDEFGIKSEGELPLRNEAPF